MVKLYVVSDLHLEDSPFVPPQETVASADVVVLAGDIHPSADGIRWAAQTFEGKPVVYVAGNHEFWGYDWNAGLGEMRQVAAECGVHFLENDAVVLAGTRFLGCSLWTDYKYSGADRQAEATATVTGYPPDYQHVTAKPDGSEFLTPAMTTARHEESLAWLAAELDSPFDGSKVVVSYHFPHKKSCNPKYAGDLLTAAYGSQLEEVLLRKRTCGCTVTRTTARTFVLETPRATCASCATHGVCATADLITSGRTKRSTHTFW